MHRVNQYNRKALIKAVSDGTVTSAFCKSVYLEEICVYCNNKTPKNLRTLDHVIPLANGGLHSAANIKMACFSCNSSKGKKTEEEFLLRKNK